jgi:hypothetical protein
MRFALGLSVLAGGCGGGKTPAATSKKVAERDAGYVSGSEPYDAEVPQPRKDAGTASIPAGEPEPGLTGGCAVDSNKIYTVAERTEPFLSTPLAVDPQESRFVVPYVNTGSCVDAVRLATLEGAATSGAPTTATAMDECMLVREAAVTAIGGHWLVATTDNREPPYDVWLTPYDASTGEAGETHRISQSARVESALAITSLSGGEAALLAYADEDLREGQGLYVRLADTTGNPSADPVKIDSSSSLYFTSLSLRPLGKGAGLVYVRYSLDYTTSEIMFVALGPNGQPLREAWRLAGNAGPSPSVDLATDSEGGGIVFARAEASTGRQIWFQQIDTDGLAALQRSGAARAPALRIVGAERRGIDVSVTKLRTTFILGYRELPQGNATRAALRAYFLDRYGAVVGSSDVSLTSIGGGRTALQSSEDGRVVLAWNELGENGGSSLKVVRVPCVGN